MKWKNIEKNYKDKIISMSNISPYTLFEINKDSSLSDLKKAYKRLVKVYHPDRSHPFMQKHNEELLKIINRAYELIESEMRNGN
jgi:curved DNA-binding protein CbpA